MWNEIDRKIGIAQYAESLNSYQLLYS
jgi:hypothetical protein